MGKKKITKNNLKALLKDCKTQNDIDGVLRDNVVVWFKDDQMEMFINQQRRRIIDAGGGV